MRLAEGEALYAGVDVCTEASMMPTRIMPIALMTEPDDSDTAPNRPTNISEKYSAAPNLKAMADKGAANAANTNVPTQPAKKEPIAAVAMATPA